MTIAKTDARKQYSGDDSTTVFAFPYRFFADADIDVYLLDAAGTETLQTLTTHYTLSNNGDETGGNVTMVTPPATGETLTIVRTIAQTQITDYAANDAFPAETHEAALDRLTLLVQDAQEQLDRAVKVDVSETVDIDTLQANINTLVAIDDDITTVAGISANVTTVAGVSADVTTVAGISANVTTVAGISANVTTVAGISANVTTVAGISANVTTVAGISADVTTVAGISSDVTNLAAGTWPLFLKQTFDTTTADADPGAGKIRFNNATPASVTEIYFDNADADTNDITGLLDSWSDGQMVIRQVNAPTKWAVYTVTAVADATGYRRFTVTHVDSGTLPDNAATVGIAYAAQGADGTGTLNNVVEDTTPQLGGDLDLNSNDITGFTGKQTIWIPASAMIPATTSGPLVSQVEETTNKHNYSTLDFDASADEYATFEIMMPKSWDEGTIEFYVVWSSTATGTTGIAFALQGVAVADGDDSDVAYGTAVLVTDDNISNAGDVLISAISAAVTIAGTPVAGELCQFRVYRDVSDANDDMTEDMQLRGVQILYNTNTLKDD